MCVYCGSCFFLLICVQLYKQNRYIDTLIKGHVKGVESSSIYTIRAVMLYMSEVSKVHTGLSIQSYVTHVEGLEMSNVCRSMSEVSKVKITFNTSNIDSI